VGGVPEMIVDGGTGVLVPPDDPPALAHALNLLLGDPELRLRIGTAGRARALAEFSVDAMARKYEALYAEITTRGDGVEPR
jgi:starch synthase